MNKRIKIKYFILICFISILFIINFSQNEKYLNSNNLTSEKNNTSNQSYENIEKNNFINTENNYTKEYDWQIEIPSISLKAEIKEGTDENVINKYVAHFTETSITDGNVALAAHNRGYEVNYFANIKNLKMEDEIIYKYKDYKKVYKVQKTEVIKDTDWSYIKNTKDNVITLITCVENQPELRRVIRGIERK